MRTLFIATICLFAISGVQASDEDEVQMMGGERLDETLKKDAKSRLESSEDIVVDPDNLSILTTSRSKIQQIKSEQN